MRLTERSRAKSTLYGIRARCRRREQKVAELAARARGESHDVGREFTRRRVRRVECNIGIPRSFNTGVEPIGRRTYKLRVRVRRQRPSEVRGPSIRPDPIGILGPREPGPRGVHWTSLRRRGRGTWQ